MSQLWTLKHFRLGKNWSSSSRVLLCTQIKVSCMFVITKSQCSTKLKYYLDSNAAIHIKGCKCIWAVIRKNLQTLITHSNNPEQAVFFCRWGHQDKKVLQNNASNIRISFSANLLQTKSLPSQCCSSEGPNTIFQSLKKKKCIFFCLFLVINWNFMPGLIINWRRWIYASGITSRIRENCSFEQ